VTTPRTPPRTTERSPAEHGAEPRNTAEHRLRHVPGAPVHGGPVPIAAVLTCLPTACW
jgi:hypothetical protein